MIKIVLYSRSDVVGVGVPADGGGCGIFHSRPVIDGAPAKLFAIDCPPCEAYLKTRLPDQWTQNRWDIPLTPDEEREAELLEAQARRLQETRTATETREAVQEIKASKAAEEAALAAVPPPERPTGPSGPTSEDLARDDETADLAGLTVAQLRIKAREAGVSQAGSKKDLIARLEAARG